MDLIVGRTAFVLTVFITLLFAIAFHIICMEEEVVFPDDGIPIKSFAWPNHVTRVIFPGSFNQPIDSLPDSVTYLEVGDDFDRHIVFPKNLKHFVVGHDYNYPLDGLPNGVKKLEFGFYFNQPLNDIPTTVENIVVGNRFTQPVDKLPPSVTSFRVVDKSKFRGVMKSGLYRNTSLWFDRPVESFPPTVKFIQVGPYVLRDIKKR